MESWGKHSAWPTWAGLCSRPAPLSAPRNFCSASALIHHLEYSNISSTGLLAFNPPPPSILFIAACVIFLKYR